MGGNFTVSNLCGETTGYQSSFPTILGSTCTVNSESSFISPLKHRIASLTKNSTLNLPSTSTNNSNFN